VKGQIHQRSPASVPTAIHDLRFTIYFSICFAMKAVVAGYDAMIDFLIRWVHQVVTVALSFCLGNAFVFHKENKRFHTVLLTALSKRLKCKYG